MQTTLFPDYFLEELEKTEGFLSQPLKIVARFLDTDSGFAILKMIASDQKKHGETKKLRRCGSEILSRSGRSPMPAPVVFILLVARGFISGCYGKRGYGFLRENHALLRALSRYGISQFPGRSTIHENLGLLSRETLREIFCFQLAMIQNEGLDDFNTATIDSTSVAADSAAPNTARLVCYYVKKIIEVFQEEQLPKKRLIHHFDKILNLTLSILNCGRSKRIKQKRKKLNRELLSRVDKVLNFLEHKKINNISESSLDTLQPLYEGLNEMYFQITKEFFPERFDGEIQRRYSISDEQASFIKKGSKNSVFGYKFHIARSTGGFICSMVLNVKNPSDSKCFKEVVEDIQQNINQTPKELSLDSGYCSKKNRCWAEEQGISKLSFSGGKGRLLLSDDEWNEYKYLRDFRAISEGIFSILKDSFDLRRFSVRGFRSVEKLLMEKVIAFNFEQIARKLRKKRNEKAA